MWVVLINSAVTEKSEVVTTDSNRHRPSCGECEARTLPLSHRLLRAAQRQNDLWSRVIYVLESGDDSSLPHLPIPLHTLALQDDVLCHKVTISRDEVTQLVIPSALVGPVLQLLHDTPQAGHPGRDKTLAAARAKYY